MTCGLRGSAGLPAAALLALAAGLAASGQTPRLIPDIAVAEAEYRDAQLSWLQNDPALERDLFTADPAEMRTRIRKAASLRDDVMVKKVTYLSLLIQRIQETRKRLGPGSPGSLPVEALRKELETQQGRLLNDQERVDALIRDLPVSDEYALVRRSLETEKADLIKLQNNVALRINSLRRAGMAQDAAAAAAANPVEPQLEAILEVWEEERKSAVRQRTSWAGVYASMEKSLSQAPSPAAKKGGQPRPAAAAPESRTAVSQTWIYTSQRDAWGGYGEPQSVTLELRTEGNIVSGVYTAKLPVRGGVNEVRLVFKGPKTGDSALVKWSSTAPSAEGEMKLTFTADRRLLVERTRSSDSYIPRGMEVLVPRP